MHRACAGHHQHLAGHMLLFQQSEGQVAAPAPLASGVEATTARVEPAECAARRVMLGSERAALPPATLARSSSVWDTGLRGTTCIHDLVRHEGQHLGSI